MPAPEPIHAHALDNLRFIRDAMARASEFTALPGWGGVAMGATALAADVVTLDGNAVIDSAFKAKYDAIYFAVTWTDTDPALTPDFWFSSGAFHVWDMQQPAPATEWERQIDALMTRQTASSDMAERKKLSGVGPRRNTFTTFAPPIFSAL